MAVRDDKSQKRLYNHLYCFQKHFAYFDRSLELVLCMIEDNHYILSKLSETFFESLNIVKDLLSAQDKKQFFEVDVEIVDKNGYLYREVTKETSKQRDPDESIDEIIEPDVEIHHKISSGRPTNLLVYLLILLSRKVRKPLIL